MPQLVSKNERGMKSSGALHLMDSSTKKGRTPKDGKKLSFFPGAEDSDDVDDGSINHVSQVRDIAEDVDASDRILTSDTKARGQSSPKELDSDNEASSTGSCSCEDHSSVSAKFDEDPDGDLDYDEGSIVNSPSHDIQQSNSIDETPGQKLPPTGDFNEHDAKRSGAKTADKSCRTAENNSYSSDKEDTNKGQVKLKSFIAGQNDRAIESEFQVSRPKKHGLRKNYRTLLKYFFKDACYFQIKSINHENVELSKSMGVWSTLLQNQVRLNSAFLEHRNVILIFSVQQSGAFQGFARMISKARPTDRPIPWVLPERLNRDNLGGVLKIEWLCTKELSFNSTRDLRNPFNDNKPVKVARDGQQLESRVGEELCMLFPQDSKKRLLKCVETLKEQLRKSHKKGTQSRLEYYPLDNPRPCGNTMPPPMYPNILNNYHAMAQQQSSHAPYHFEHQIDHLPNREMAFPRGRLGGRRQSDHFRKFANVYEQHPNQYFNPTLRLGGYPPTRFDCGPPLFPSNPAHGFDPAVPVDLLEGMYLDFNNYGLHPHLDCNHRQLTRPPYLEQKERGSMMGQNPARYHPYQRRTKYTSG